MIDFYYTFLFYQGMILARTEIFYDRGWGDGNAWWS